MGLCILYWMIQQFLYYLLEGKFGQFVRICLCLTSLDSFAMCTPRPWMASSDTFQLLGSSRSTLKLMHRPVKAPQHQTGSLILLVTEDPWSWLQTQSTSALSRSTGLLPPVSPISRPSCSRHTVEKEHHWSPRWVSKRPVSPGSSKAGALPTALESPHTSK